MRDLSNLDEQSKVSWDETYQVHKGHDFWGQTPVPFVQLAVKTFQEDAANIVLDLPCGDGRNLVHLMRDLPFIVGGDTSRVALEAAAHYIAGLPSGRCVLQEVDIFRTPFVGEQFDGVFCADVLGHLTRPQEAIAELLRVCRRNKCVVGSLFALGDSTRGVDMTRIGPEEYVYSDKFYFKFYDKAEVTRLLESVQAEILSIELARWTEPPHKGYREYEHEHQSWVFTVRKRI
jgi:SAM-dependent methyltransferase